MTQQLLSSDDYGIILIIGEGTWQNVDQFSYVDINDTPVGGYGVVIFIGSCSVGVWNLDTPNTTLTLNILNSNTLQSPLVFGFTDLGGTNICLAARKYKLDWGYVEYEGIKSFPECLKNNKTFGEAYLEWLNSAVEYTVILYYNNPVIKPIKFKKTSLNSVAYQMFGDGSLPIT